MPDRPGHITIGLVEDSDARTRAFQKEADDIIGVLAIARPKTPDERNLELLQKYQARNLPLPRTAGVDLNEINNELERRLNDQSYEFVKKNLPEAQRRARIRFKKHGAGRIAEAAFDVGLLAVNPPLGPGTSRWA